MIFMRVKNAHCEICGKTGSMRRITRREDTGEIRIVCMCDKCMEREGCA